MVLELDPERLSARDDLQRNVLEMQTHVTAVLEDIRCVGTAGPSAREVAMAVSAVTCAVTYDGNGLC